MNVVLHNTLQDNISTVILPGVVKLFIKAACVFFSMPQMHRGPGRYSLKEKKGN